MSRSQNVRTGGCSRPEAVNRLKQDEAFVMVADLCLSDETNVATPGVAAALAVLAAIAASDTACCITLGQRTRGKDHSQAAVLVDTITPDGKRMSTLLRDVLAAKDDSHYGFALITAKKARTLVNKAQALTEWADAIVQA